MSFGVVARERESLGLATVLVRKGCDDALAQRVRQRFQIELPRRPERRAAKDVAFIATGPGAWLATHEHAGNQFALMLSEGLRDLAAVADQTDGYVVLRLSGPRVRDALVKLVPIDLHPRAFAVNDAVATLVAHMGITLWRLEDDAAGSAVFELAVFRSLAASLWHALEESATEFGLGKTP
jgi:methylglutamate dehydrogenase subunit D